MTRRIHKTTPALALAIATLALYAPPAPAAHNVFGQVSLGQVNGNGAYAVTGVRASADGTRVFLTSKEKLASEDTDSSTDVYERTTRTTKLVSSGAVNGNGAYDARFLEVSADGRRVLFETAERLTANDTNSASDIYERSADATTRVSVPGPGGLSRSGPARFVGASKDGTRVFFENTERYHAGDTDNSVDVFERSGGTTKQVSVGQVNGNGGYDVDFRLASSDGTRVIFGTGEKLTSDDTDSHGDVYERSGGVTKRISGGQVHGNGPYHVEAIHSSANATRVFMTTIEQLTSDDTDTFEDLYEWSGSATNLVSTGPVAGEGYHNFDSLTSSADGTRVFFESRAQLTSDDTDAAEDVYERSAGTTTRVSKGPAGGNGAYDAWVGGVSTDGSRVFFNTAEQLTTDDTDTHYDVYELRAGVTTRVSRGDTNGNGASAALFSDASDDGSRVFFTTLESLSTRDSDTQSDAYSACEEVDPALPCTAPRSPWGPAN